RAQQPAHDLAGAGFRQIVAKADVARLGDGADFLADPVLQLLYQLFRVFAFRTRLLQHDEGDHRFAGEVIGAADDRGFGHEAGIGDQRRLDFHGAEAVAGDVQYVVDAAHDADVAVLVIGRAVAGEVVLAVEILGEVGLPETFGITPDRAQHRR